MRSRAFAGSLISRRCGCLRIGAVPVAGLRRGGADGRVVRNASASSGHAALSGSRAPHRGRATNSEHPGCPARAARPQRAHHPTTMATIALENNASLLLRVPCDPSGKYKCQFQIFTCNARARKPTQLGADGRACGARGGAARLRRPPAAQANVGLSRGTTSTASVTSILVDVAEANACRRSIRRVRRAAPGSRWHLPFLKSGRCRVVQDTLFLGEPRIFGAL